MSLHLTPSLPRIIRWARVHLAQFLRHGATDSVDTFGNVALAEVKERAGYERDGPAVQAALKQLQPFPSGITQDSSGLAIPWGG